MDYKSIEQLIKAMNESSLTELIIEGEDLSIKMSKNKTPLVVKDEESSNNKKVDINNIDIISDNKEEVKEEKVVKKVKEGKAIVSPIVGTFYASPSPDADNFVKIGSKVKKGDTLCIVEAMKLMNEIQSDVEGEVVEILASTGQMVEYGQELFIIKES